VKLKVNKFIHAGRLKIGEVCILSLMRFISSPCRFAPPLSLEERGSAEGAGGEVDFVHKKSEP